MSTVNTDKSKVEISQNFVAFSEYMNFKYNFRGLLEYCSKHLKSNLTVESAAEVLLTAHFTNQTELFKAASNFVRKTNKQLVKTKAWRDLVKTNPTLVANVLSNMLGLQ